MQILRALALTALAGGVFASTASADVRLTIQRGHVTLIAKDATVRQILAEWARVGQAKIVNAERVPGGLVTLELIDVPEQQALDVVLRAVSGYVAAPRATPVANGSVFDRIVVMPTTVAPAAPPSAAPAAAAAFGQQPPRPVFDDQEDDKNFSLPPGVTRPPVFAVPTPPVTNGQRPPAVFSPTATQVPPVFQPPTPSPAPPVAPYPGAPTATAPVGVAVPGMVVPAPAPQPGQPGQFVPGIPGQPQ